MVSHDQEEQFAERAEAQVDAPGDSDGGIYTVYIFFQSAPNGPWAGGLGQLLYRAYSN